MTAPKTLRAACLQMNATADLEHNLLKIEALIQQALAKKAQWILLPENFYGRVPAEKLSAVARQLPWVVKHFQTLSRRHRVAFLLGSLMEKTPAQNKFYNTSFLISEKGNLAARYRKIHLFDIGLKKMRASESRHIQAGKTPVTGKVFNMMAGLSVCYDLRFPELYRHLTKRGARILTVPANFTDYTGRAHWEVLLRARAIENQAFVIAPGQVGVHPESGIKSFGHSLIIDPWGSVLAEGSSAREEVIVADLDFRSQNRLRKGFPVLSHQKIT